VHVWSLIKITCIY